MALGVTNRNYRLLIAVVVLLGYVVMVLRIPQKKGPAIKPGQSNREDSRQTPDVKGISGRALRRPAGNHRFPLPTNARSMDLVQFFDAGGKYVSLTCGW